ncbi:tRNA (adenosine(37)-N6)-threonylcarbamoyltransferase complex dimerization subunit type 1 TsaB [Saprospira sp. CCB-QB6]|uniref:tRNA (adenosine(37)-N6)-threonylcarbamoyltransferase complex dimerization subunit type 1 TsaB n=1 Tax=Saprospira sp. CCB-QB6 TaxID=3023936 RepID=UPI00234910A0|nr:tRNA (adenosine(37)-N6)-threonylcarbamoyltransferase complex dimerization subunit type 1 TsaB [Saprospira sp. CCB-QB6]WCL82451.1 tRNA (adenosine(37)-N6)-threonylcarbamoyltransferase complex dimerization subunit type 1 TsaB [Saprospira sp. CCB-QB6]
MDQLILVLESSSRKTSVALIKNGHCWLVEESTGNTGDPAAELTLFVQKILQHAQIKGSQLTAIGVSKGPGSYTGLRIAYSTAKGLAFAWQCPLLALDTLAALAYGAKWNQELPANSLLVCLEDARRGNAYAAIYNLALEPVKSPFFVSLKDLDLEGYKEEQQIYLLGSAAAAYQELTSQNGNNFNMLPLTEPSARFFEQLAQKEYEQALFADLAYSEPFYLRAPHLTKPKKNKFFSQK